MVASASAIFGQTTAGAVTGNVLDATGAIVQNATVTLRNKATGQVLTTQSTGSGSYNFPNVPAGEYTITIENAGFQPVTKDLTSVLNQTTTVDATLQAGGASTTVEVTAASEALVQTDSSQLGKNFETRQVLDLPIFGNQNTLALLSPNVVGQSAGTAGSGGSVGGTRARANSFNVDGVDNNDPSVTGPQVSVIQDAIQEFTLLTNNYNAEFGTGSGGQFNTITKTGTNEFHGSGFLYTQNQRLNAASTSQESQIQSGEINERPRFRDTRFGGTLGGPIFKNKLFFFGAYQREPTSQEGAGTTFQAPTAAGLAQIAGLPGASPFVVNLLRNNLTLASSADPAATATFGTVLGTPGIPFGNVTVNVPQNSNDDQFQINIDQLRGTKDQFRYRFSYDRFLAIQPGNGNTTFNNNLTQNTRLFSATYVRTFSPSVVNDLRLSYRRYIQDFPLLNSAFNNFPNLTVSTLNLSLGPNENLPQGGFNNSYQVFDSANYIRGKHSFKFGGEFRDLIFTSFFLPRGRGDYQYTNFDELLRDQVPGNVDLRGVGSSAFTGNNKQYYAFAQDDYKVTPNLTLNLGVRYEYVTLPRDARLQALNAVSSVPGVITFGVPKTDKNNFAPRVGFAYAPGFENGIGKLFFGERGKSSIRGNFSISYSQVFQNLALLQLPPQFQQELDTATSAQAFGFSPTRPFLQSGGIPASPIPPTTAADARAATGGIIVDQTAPYTEAYALSIQRQLTSSMAIEVRYLGTQSHKLPVQIRLNEATVNPNNLVLPTFIGNQPAGTLGGPTLGALFARPDVFVGPLERFGFGGFVTSFPPVGNSNYNSGSVSLTRRFSKGLAFTSAYTFSKTIDNSTNELFTSRVNPRRPQNGFNLRDERSRSAFDIPHRFAASVNYEVPNFSENRFVKAVVRGFSINGIFQAQSGQPITPLSGIDSNLDFDSAGDRTLLNPNGVAGTGSAVIGLDRSGNPVIDPRTQNPVALTNSNLFAGRLDNIVAYRAVNPNAQYIQAGFLARATAGRNTLRANGFNRTDMTFLKNIRFAEERYNIQLGAEVFNLFNQRIRTIGNESNGNPALVTAGVGATTSAFANVNSGTNFNNYALGNFAGRTVQLRAKFIF